jgi:hypothetical protein
LAAGFLAAAGFAGVTLGAGEALAAGFALGALGLAVLIWFAPVMLQV